MNFKNNQHKNIKPYKAKNMMIRKMAVHTEHSETDQVTEQPSENDVGYINVGVFTASGALPVQDAVVTVYHTYNDGEEHVVYHLVTDESGKIPLMEVPIEYQGEGQQTEYSYSTYNMRVQAIGYYTVNILDLQVFPGVSTDYRINLIPVAQGNISQPSEQVIVIPPKPENSLNQ